jgi:Toprim-like
MNNYNIDVEKYLQEKGIKIIQDRGTEITLHCLFGGCDKDSKGSEAHLYINKIKGLYSCKKCSAEGNFIELKKYFGDFTPTTSSLSKKQKYFTPKMIEECANNIPDRIRKYINSRGVSDEIIEKYKLGFGEFYSDKYITLPIKLDEHLEFNHLYLRQDPEGSGRLRNASFPPKKGEAVLWGEFADEGEDLIITEGFFDCLSLLSLGKKSVFSTGGAGTFKDTWLTENLLKSKRIFVAYDNDEAGKKGALKVLTKLKSFGCKKLHQINLSEIVGDKGDVNDYLVKFKLPAEDLIEKYSETYPKQIDHKQFKEIEIAEVEDILSQNIKGDRENKLLTFYSCLSAFTENSQYNIKFNGPSSSGKSYTALEVAKLFPKESLQIISHSSPTAFFHENGKYDKEENTITVDLSRKILIFTENQNNELLVRLRGFLSHDMKVLVFKTTDKNEKGGNRTKTVQLIGYASVIFCSANLKTDAQEKTRFIQLSPDITEDKIRAGINKVVERESKADKFTDSLDKNESRSNLKLRIEAIQNANIQNIYISDDDAKYLSEKFFSDNKILQPRHSRDIQRIISIAKSIALLNLWFRDFQDENITIHKSDIDEALNLYQPLALTQNLGITPYLFQVYNEIIKPCYLAKIEANLGSEIDGIKYQDILNYHFKFKGHKLDYSYLRQNIMPELEACGLVERTQIGVSVAFHLPDIRSEYQVVTVSDEVGGVKS